MRPEHMRDPSSHGIHDAWKNPLQHLDNSPACAVAIRPQLGRAWRKLLARAARRTPYGSWVNGDWLRVARQALTFVSGAAPSSLDLATGNEGGAVVLDDPCSTTTASAAITKGRAARRCPSQSLRLPGPPG